jgi:rhodanese-related sulfurtransferase
MSLLQRLRKWMDAATGGEYRLSANDVSALLAAKQKLYILDVRSAQEFRGDGHIAGANLIPLAELTSHLKKIPTDRLVVTVCRSGARSGSAHAQLQNAGFTNVKNLSGGMMAWQSAGLPVVRK